MAESFQCMYLRGITSELSKKYGSSDQRYLKLTQLFPEIKEDVTKNQLDVIARRLETTMKRRWTGKLRKADFKKRFSVAKWQRLSRDDKARHTRLNCSACSAMQDWQTAFPTKSSKFAQFKEAPCHAAQNVGPSVESQHDELRRFREEWNEHTGRTLEEDLAVISGATLQKKQTPAERKREERKISRKNKEKQEEHMARTGMDSCLQDRVSFSAWERKRKRDSFEPPEAKRARYASQPPKSRSHSPKTQNWDTDAVLQAARSWPEDKVVNWSALARAHNVAGPNGGQIVKEYLQKNGIDVLKMEKRDVPRQRQRARKMKFGCGVSFPAQKSTEKIKEDIKSAVAEGRYILGEDCAGTVICKYVTTNGEVERRELDIRGRKVSLLDLRRHLLSRHESAGIMRSRPYMLEQYLSMEREQVIDELNCLDEYDPQADEDKDTSDLATRLFTLEHTRLLLLGSDHADLLGHSYLMEVVQVVYDTALFLTDEEYEEQTGKPANVQAMVEAPVIRLLAMSGSKEEEQLRVVPDRTADLHCTEAPLDRTVGEPIVDALVGYIGDLQGRWFEAGLQKGGEYRCGAGCGCPSSRIKFYADNVSRTLPSYRDLQQRALAGMYGRVPGVNLHHLPIARLRNELHRRGIRNTALMDRPQLNQELRAILKGVQRVPALLAFEPRSDLSRFALNRFQIMPCEPLHDLKGHISHVLTELPHHLPKEVGQQIADIVNSAVGDHNRGCDWRKALFQCTNKVQSCLGGGKEHLLLRRLADVATIMYSRATERCPKMVLRLSLSLWHHFELLREIIQVPKTISLGALYGGYLHGLLHSPLQFAVVSLSSTDTETLERQQGQSRTIAQAVSSRRPSEVVPTVLLRVQAEMERRDETGNHDVAENAVGHEARQLHPLGCTLLKLKELTTEEKKANCLALLKSIAMFLKYGPGVWWHAEDDIVFFHDGQYQPHNRPEGPRLRNIRSCTMQQWHSGWLRHVWRFLP